MQLGDALCYILLTITVTASCAEQENRQSLQTAESKEEKRISKRETAVLIENYPIYEASKQKPKVIYRRVQRYPYRQLKPKYGPPRPKYGAVQHKKTKYRGKHVKYNHSPISRKPNKKRPSKTRFVAPKQILSKKKPNMYSKRPQGAPKPVGFGEPPAEYNNYANIDHQPAFEEPIVDSYGAPLRTAADESFNQNHGYFMEADGLDGSVDGYRRPGIQQWSNDQHPIDHSFAHSNKYPSYLSVDNRTPETSIRHSNPVDYNDDTALNSYADVYNYGNKLNEGTKHATKFVNRPWKGHRETQNNQVLVGGQYAEPPARYIPNFQPSAIMFSEDEDSFNPPRSYDADSVGSGTISTYVNYKNSNMAFSPQNLNDAFSIVDKK